jgi:hypothetical protein
MRSEDGACGAENGAGMRLEQYGPVQGALGSLDEEDVWPLAWSVMAVFWFPAWT